MIVEKGSQHCGSPSLGPNPSFHCISPRVEWLLLTLPSPGSSCSTFWKTVTLLPLVPQPTCPNLTLPGEYIHCPPVLYLPFPLSRPPSNLAPGSLFLCHYCSLFYTCTFQWVTELGVELCLPERYVEDLIPGTYECDVIWKLGIFKRNQVKMRSFIPD